MIRPANVPEDAHIQWEIELLGFEMPKVMKQKPSFHNTLRTCLTALEQYLQSKYNSLFLLFLLRYLLMSVSNFVLTKHVSLPMRCFVLMCGLKKILKSYLIVS